MEKGVVEVVVFYELSYPEKLLTIGGAETKLVIFIC